MWKRLIAIAITCWAASASAQQFNDDFEAPALDAYWNHFYSTPYATGALSTEQARSGVQSFKMDALDGGQRFFLIGRDFVGPTKGSFSVHIYDTAPGQETQYAQLGVYDFAAGRFFDFGIFDLAPSEYLINLSDATGSSSLIGSGVARSLGWHKFQIDMLASDIVFSIDDNEVYRLADDLSAAQVRLSLFSPEWRPAQAFYFDDYSGPIGAVPEPASIALLLAGLGTLAMRARGQGQRRSRE
jgi:hypothetical protein